MSIDDKVLFSSIGDVRRRMDAGDFGPVALTEEMLSRIDRSQNSLNSFISVTSEIALQEAKAAEDAIRNGKAKGPLHGIPLAYKDLLATAGTRTTFASRAYADWIPDYDATQVRRFREAGAIMLGKLNLAEGAADSSSQSSAFGGPRNPWDLDRIPGGSSGGSAAAVAAGLAFGAIGSDTAMSIRQPAALCGIVGLKPTYGRVSKHGAMKNIWNGEEIKRFRILHLNGERSQIPACASCHYLNSSTKDTLDDHAQDLLPVYS